MTVFHVAARRVELTRCGLSRYTPSWKSTDTADSIEHVPSWTGPGPVDVDAAHDTLEERLAALREQP